MPLSPEEIVETYAAGATAYPNGRPLAPYRDGPRVLHRAEDALRSSAKQFERE